MRHGRIMLGKDVRLPKLGDAEDDALAALERQGGHLAGVAGRVDDLCLFQALGPAAGEKFEEDEGWEEVDRVEKLVGVLEYGVDVTFRP